MKITIVGGTWDDNGGKNSSVIASLASEIKLYKDKAHSVLLLNGGNYSELDENLNMGGEWADVIMWFPNVSNDKDKIRVKERFPKKMLVTSKRNNGEYSFMELVNRALGAKANLVLEFSKQDDGLYAGRVIDPLGAIWCDYTTDFETVANKLMSRLEYLVSVTRVSSRSINTTLSLVPPDQDEFYALIKDYAEDFHRLMMPEDGVERFLGNASFRCIKSGFPSFRGEDGIVFVSRRNIDKRFIGPEGFVATKLDDKGNVEYWGTNKPSVDTPIQLRLYDKMPNVNFMLHAHVYVDDVLYSDYPVPCGAIEEVDKVLSLVNPNDTDFALNLLGHGSIVFASSVDFLKNIKYIGRDIPEIIENSHGH